MLVLDAARVSQGLACAITDRCIAHDSTNRRPQLRDRALTPRLQPRGEVGERRARHLTPTLPDALRLRHKRDKRNPAVCGSLLRIKRDHAAGAFVTGEVEILRV